MSGRVDSTSPTTLDRGSMTRTRNSEWGGGGGGRFTSILCFTDINPWLSCSPEYLNIFLVFPVWLMLK